mmetsp:Transcript_28502/g.68600  ORF Transcript_28502/g.68600 Transcript_28502/m.68600 type:complete len:131 (+) Transcript_28502:116-508(+)
MDAISAITIDDECQLRIIRPEVHGRSTSLIEECQLLVSKIKEFQAIVAHIHSEMNRLADSREREKLKAIGRRVKLEHNSEDALRREEELLLSKIKAKENEMGEFSSYLASLEHAEGEQMVEIEKLENERK